MNGIAKSEGMMERLSVTEQLRMRKENLKRELAEIEETLTVLLKHPDLQNVIDRLSRLGYR